MICNFRSARRRGGFTLLELLVVISIIGILIALGAAAYTTAQKRGRDSRRKGDMKAVQSAFEQYNADNNGSYSTTCATMAVAPYMPGGLPSDPKEPAQSYVYDCSGLGSYDYCLCAQMEGDKGNSDDSACTYDNSGDEGWFCVSNLQ